MRTFVSRFGVLIAIMLVVALVGIILGTSSAHAIGFFEGQTRFSSDAKATQQLTLYTQKDVGTGLGYFTWSQVNNSWGQLYGGMTYSPLTWIQAAAGVGLEVHEGRSRRFGSYLLVDRPHQIFAVAAYEDGGSGKWHTAYALFPIRQFLVGVMEEKFVGIGPRADIRVGPAKLWTATLSDSDGPTGLLALQYWF